MKKTALTLTLFLTSSLVSAAQEQTIDSFQLNIWSNTTYIQPNNGSTAIDPAGCAENTGSPATAYRLPPKLVQQDGNLQIPQPNDKTDLMEAALLLAYSQKRPIRVRLDGCLGIFPKVITVRLIN